MKTTLFEIRRRSPGEPISRILDVECLRGTALGPGADSESAALAQGSKFLGFVTRDVVEGGPTLQEIVLPTDLLGLPHTKGQQVGIERADEIECEGDDYILLSGTGSISAATSVGAKLSFKDGKLYQAQTGDVVYYTLTAQVTDDTKKVTAGAVRIIAEAARA